MLEWLVDCVSKAYHTVILVRPEREEKLVHVDTVASLRARLMHVAEICIGRTVEGLTDQELQTRIDDLINIFSLNSKSSLCESFICYT
jgi:hypothetical protein